MKDIFYPSESDISEIELEDHLEICDCGKSATWVYVPHREDCDENPYYCDDCVPRGCSCDIECTKKYFQENYPEDVEMAYEPDTYEGEWIWIEEGISWRPVDQLGRPYPCCEFWKL